MALVFDKLLKLMVDLISDSKIRSVETGYQNLLNPALMVIDFISKTWKNQYKPTLLNNIQQTTTCV